MQLARVVNASYSRSDHNQTLFLDYPTLFKILEQSWRNVSFSILLQWPICVEKNNNDDDVKTKQKSLLTYDQFMIYIPLS